MATALDAYRSEAGGYDQRTRQFQLWRELLVARLPTQPGDTVLDVGCGTGLCLPLLRDKVGRTGTVVGIDESTQMLAVASARVTRRGWQNVRLHSAPLAEVVLDVTADAAIFCAVHDVMQSPAALRNVFKHLRFRQAVAVARRVRAGPPRAADRVRRRLPCDRARPWWGVTPMAVATQ